MYSIAPYHLYIYKKDVYLHVMYMHAYVYIIDYGQVGRRWTNSFVWKSFIHTKEVPVVTFWKSIGHGWDRDWSMLGQLLYKLKKSHVIMGSFAFYIFFFPLEFFQWGKGWISPFQVNKSLNIFLSPSVPPYFILLSSENTS